MGSTKPAQVSVRNNIEETIVLHVFLRVNLQKCFVESQTFAVGVGAMRVKPAWLFDPIGVGRAGDIKEKSQNTAKFDITNIEGTSTTEK